MLNDQLFLVQGRNSVRGDQLFLVHTRDSVRGDRLFLAPTRDRVRGDQFLLVQKRTGLFSWRTGRIVLEANSSWCIKLIVLGATSCSWCERGIVLGVLEAKSYSHCQDYRKDSVCNNNLLLDCRKQMNSACIRSDKLLAVPRDRGRIVLGIAHYTPSYMD